MVGAGVGLVFSLRYFTALASACPPVCGWVLGCGNDGLMAMMIVFVSLVLPSNPLNSCLPPTVSGIVAAFGLACLGTVWTWRSWEGETWNCQCIALVFLSESLALFLFVCCIA
jgi:hypothetical protein